jgi:transcriptional regulator with XRE-family HTH domain
MDTTQERLRASVRAITAAFDDTQTDLAAALGVSQNTVSKKIRGFSRWTLTDVETLAKHYGVTVDQLMAGPRSWLGLPEGGDGQDVNAC